MKRLVATALIALFLTSASAHAQPPSFEDLIEDLLPTVVNVSSTVKLSDEIQSPVPQLPPGSPFEDFFKDFFDQYGGSAPMLPENQSSLGSGFVIDADKGLIVTNHHVIKNAEEIKVILHDDTSLSAELVGSDEKTDLALLRVKTDRKLAAAKWGNSDEAKIGSWVLAIGNPFGLGGTITAGIVSARQRDIGAGAYDDFIQTDASINRGNSGGPMFNTKGEVIGINTAIFSPSGGSVGIGFATPSNLARPVIEQLEKYGTTRRGWLGVRIQEVTAEIAEGLGLKESRGALVSSVTQDGPAAKAGVQTGDVILSFNGRDITAMRHLPRIVAETPVGTRTPLVIWRKGSQKTLQVTLGELEKAEEEGLMAQSQTADGPQAPGGRTTKVEALDLSVAVLDEKRRQFFNIDPSLKGVVITEVIRNGTAAQRGLMPGDVIIELDQKEVTTPDQVLQRLEQAQARGLKSVLLFVARDNDRRFVALKIKEPKKGGKGKKD